MNLINQLLALSEKQVLLILLLALGVFVILITALGIAFIVAIRKRRPVVKVVMAPLAKMTAAEAEAEAEAEEAAEAEAAAEAKVEDEFVTEATEASEEEVPMAPEISELELEEEDEEEEETLVTEGNERVRDNRSFTAKICQSSHEVKEWYSAIKNELLSYNRIKDRMSWKRESFRIGRMTLARLTMRGKTLCLLLAVEPLSYTGSKYQVEDVAATASTADTPTLYRIKSARRLKYAKEMIAGMMKEVQTYKMSGYEAQDYFLPYDGDMSLIQRGLIKRIVSGTTRMFKIEEVDEDEEETAVVDTASAEIEEDEDDEMATLITEGYESIRYNRSFTAKLCQLNEETKQWYSALKNEFLSYERVKVNMSWKRESFRIGRSTIARFTVRGKTLCMLLAVDPSTYADSKYTVEDMSATANTADTPSLYRIKSARRLKYAKEMIAAMLKDVCPKKQVYLPEDFVMPYDGYMSLLERGLIKRVVSGSTRTFKVEGLGESEMPTYESSASGDENSTNRED